MSFTSVVLLIFFKQRLERQPEFTGLLGSADGTNCPGIGWRITGMTKTYRHQRFQPFDKPFRELPDINFYGCLSIFSLQKEKNHINPCRG